MHESEVRSLCVKSSNWGKSIALNGRVGGRREPARLLAFAVPQHYFRKFSLVSCVRLVSRTNGAAMRWGNSWTATLRNSRFSHP